MLATSSGIGLFLAFIGLQAQQGLGISTYSPTSVVTLGAPPAALQLQAKATPQALFVTTCLRVVGYRVHRADPADVVTRPCSGATVAHASMTPQTLV
jgi:xanthine/uracil/vitamin C permease (AzgA family)